MGSVPNLLPKRMLIVVGYRVGSLIGRPARFFQDSVDTLRITTPLTLHVLDVCANAADINEGHRSFMTKCLMSRFSLFLKLCF